jgi:hypothetical protein
MVGQFAHQTVHRLLKTLTTAKGLMGHPGISEYGQSGAQMLVRTGTTRFWRTFASYPGIVAGNVAQDILYASFPFSN